MQNYRKSPELILSELHLCARVAFENLKNMQVLSILKFQNWLTCNFYWDVTVLHWKVTHRDGIRGVARITRNKSLSGKYLFLTKHRIARRSPAYLGGDIWRTVSKLNNAHFSEKCSNCGKYLEYQVLKMLLMRVCSSYYRSTAQIISKYVCGQIPKKNFLIIIPSFNQRKIGISHPNDDHWSSSH